MGPASRLFLISGLAETYRNLLADPRASLLGISKGGRASRPGAGHAARQGAAVKPDERRRHALSALSARGCWLPRARDFRFFRMEPTGALHRRFGRMGWVDCVSAADGSSMPAPRPGCWTLAGSRPAVRACSGLISRGWMCGSAGCSADRARRRRRMRTACLQLPPTPAPGACSAARPGRWQPACQRSVDAVQLVHVLLENTRSGRSFAVIWE